MKNVHISFSDYERNLTSVVEAVEKIDPATSKKVAPEKVVVAGVHKDVLFKLKFGMSEYVQSGFEKFHRAKDYYKIRSIQMRLNAVGSKLEFKERAEKPETKTLF